MSFKTEDYQVNGINLDQIRNRYELIAVKKMKEVLPQYPDFDNCSLCIEDVYALALSRMPPVYTHKGSVILHRELSDQDVEEIIAYAILKVQKTPKHG